MEDFIEEKADTPDASKEVSAKYLPIDQNQTTQLKISSSGEYSQPQHSTGEEKKLRTNESYESNKLMLSVYAEKFDVFLSHNGKQKNFARQLYRDLTNQGVSCFFDEDRESLPLGEEFPPLIFRAAKTCTLAVFLLSEEFLQSKWPMLELSTVVQARDTNRLPLILPVFFMILPKALKQITTPDEKWTEIGMDDQTQFKCFQALKTIRRINGLNFSEGGNEVLFRDEIVKEIWRRLPTASPRYHVPYMQGEHRMCQEVANFFKENVYPNERGINIAGLYGIAGQGKTTLGKAFCNFKLNDFEGKVCHLEFSKGDSFERTKLVLQYLFHRPAPHVQNLTKDQAQIEFHKGVNNQRVLLVLDNITEDSIDEVRYFVKAGFGENSYILLSAQSLDVLVKQCKIDSQSCMRVPSLEEDEAIAILLESTSLEDSRLRANEKPFALKCANRCSFEQTSGRGVVRFHPSALKVFGKHLFGKYGSNLSKWVTEKNVSVDQFFFGFHWVGAAFDVFLCHSGKQKKFARQVYGDLTKQGVSCFFGEDHESLPVGEDFYPRIFEAAKKCKAAVLLLSKDFLETKGSLLKLFALVKAKDANPHLKIIPLFFMIPPKTLTQITADHEEWKKFEKSEERRAEWHQALNAIKIKKGLKFSEGDNEVEFRDKIVKEIWRKLPSVSPRYRVPCMQAELRMCQEVEDFFEKTVQPNEKGIRIAGLYGVAGQGKTTLGKAFCNFKLKDFEGKVCHLEFSRGDKFDRTKLALHYLIHYPLSRLQNFTIDQALVELYKRMNGQRVLLVLDNITEESIEEVRYFLEAGFRENSCILLCSRSRDVLLKHFKVHAKSSIQVPRLEEDEAIAILLENTSGEQSKLRAVDISFALKRAKRCLSRWDIRPAADRTFLPFTLKAFGGYLFGKYRSNLSNWVADIDGLVDRSGDCLDEVFAALDKAFDDMFPKYRTIFMLLTVYMLPNISFHKVIEWLTIICNEEIKFFEEAVEDLRKKAFIEEFEPEIRIHDLCFEFAKWKASEMGRWLCFKGDGSSRRGLISQDKAGFELARLESCMQRRVSDIAPKYLKNLLSLQLVDMVHMSKLDLGGMGRLRSITLHKCIDLVALEGIEKLGELAWLQISAVNRMFKLPKLSSLKGLQHLEIDIANSHALNQLGDLTSCIFLRVINVCCPSLLEFPRLNGLPYLQRVEFGMCDKVKAPLDCTECVELRSIVLVLCWQMTASPLLAGCKKLSKIVLSDCGAVTTFPHIDLPSALETLELRISSLTASAPKSLESCYRLENLLLWDMEKLEKLPRFRSLSNLTVLKIGKCGVREPPDLSCCVLLEDVCFFRLKHLMRFPNFLLLRRLKKLSLCHCSRVRDPPDISGCHQLQSFGLLYNDNMEGLSEMDKCGQLEEIKVSWRCKDGVTYEGFDPDSCQIDDDLDTCLEYFKDVILEDLNDVSVPVDLRQWVQGKPMLVKKYFRGVKLFYSVTAPCESDERSKRYGQNPIALTLVDGKMLAYSTLDRVGEDCGWLKIVQGYLDMACASAASGKKVDTSLSVAPSSVYHFKMWKTTVADACSDFNLGNFDRKVCPMEFCGGNVLDRQKFALQYLTPLHNQPLEWVTSEDKARYLFSSRMEGQRVLLLLDNITKNSIDEVKYYQRAELGEGSCILWSARSVDFLMNSKRLQEEEVIAILLERTLRANDLSKWVPEIEGFEDGLSGCLDQMFGMMDDALKDFDRFARLHTCYYHLEKWFSESDCADDLFAGLFWLAIKYMKEKLSSDKVDGQMSSSTNKNDERQAIQCKKEIMYIKGKMSSNTLVKYINCKKEVKEKVEEMKHEIRIDSNAIKEFSQIIKENYNEVVCNIEEAISHLLPRPPRYPVPSMQGETRLCQEVVDFFRTSVHVNEKRIRVAGLYGMPGLGKTTLAKAFCNLNLENFADKVCLLQFCLGNALDRLKLALRYLTEFPPWQLESIKSKDDALFFFNKFVKGERVLLVLDNIREDSIDEVRHYLGAEFGEKSCILLIARSVDVLRKFNIDSLSFMHVPRLEEDEAIAILLERMYVMKSTLGAEQRRYALKCANRCTFKEDGEFAQAFHPLALKTLGRHLFNKHRSDLSKWVAEINGFSNGGSDGLNGMFAVLEKAFEDPEYRTVLMILTGQMPPNMSSS